MLKNNSLFSFSGLLVILLFVGFIPKHQIQQNDFPERVKIAMRDVGNKLLLANKDSTSLVLPIIEKSKSLYELSFEETLEITPDDLLLFIQESFEKANLPNHYRIEVLQCADGEVAYSYQMKHTVEESIIPCKGRSLPLGCYTVKVHFIESTTAKTQEGSGLFSKPSLLYLLLFVSLVPVSVLVLKKKPNTNAVTDEDFISIGSYKLSPEQHLLEIDGAQESLSKKECELLMIFAEKPNQVIPREELTKKVWEDHGVIVGRSLDTYISKLRKKLKKDPNLHIANIHGIGYKLEVT